MCENDAFNTINLKIIIKPDKTRQDKKELMNLNATSQKQEDQEIASVV